MKYLLVLSFTLGFLILRLHIKIRGIPAPPILPTTKDQRRLTMERIRNLTPYVPVPKYDSFIVRFLRAMKGYFLVFLNVPDMFRRKALGNDQDFTPEIREKMQGYPDYYCRNYHHQTDGYFSARSARLWDMQYELVFNGIGQNVRETSASQLVRFLDPKGRYQMLEVGSGTAQLGIAVQMLFP